MSESEHDELLLQMLKECKTLPAFFDDIFGFLQRRTDFYIVASEPNIVGLPEGLAEKLVRHSFMKWKPQLLQEIYTDKDIPESNEVIVATSSDEICTVTSTTDELCTADQTSKNDYTFTVAEYYNGAAYDNYCWSQTILEIHILIKLPKSVKKKDLIINIHSNSISVKLKDELVLLEGDLYKKCKANEAIWSVNDGNLDIHLDKCQDMWWNCLIKSEPEIDISRIDCTRPYEDLPDEAQAKIQELQWNQEQKRLGLPTSDEIALQEKLKRAWNADGSPFDSPFDPTTVILN